MLVQNGSFDPSRLTREEIEEVVLQRSFKANTPEYKKLAREIHERYKFPSVSQFRKSLYKERDILYSLDAYVASLPQEAFDLRFYKHPTEYILAKKLYGYAEKWSLEDVIKICRESPKMSIKSSALYHKVRRWVRKVLHLRLNSFYKFFVFKQGKVTGKIKIESGEFK